jgi:predicted ester cyclase
MSEQNKSVVRRLFEEVWNKGNLRALDELLAPDFADHTMPPGMPDGRDGYRHLVSTFRAALPDLTFAIQRLLAEDNRVAVQLAVQGTHQGNFLEFRPTHRPVAFFSLPFFVLQNGQITDRFGISDVPSLIMQYNTAVEENKQLVRDYFDEIWGKGNLENEAKFVDKDVLVHTPPFPIGEGIVGPLQIVTTFRAAIPDMKMVHDLVFGEGDKVIHRYTVTGHHTGEPLFGAPATGKALEFTGINCFRIADGRIVERWGNLDAIRLAQQLGLAG